MQAAARIILSDWNDGRIAYYTLPPPRTSDTTTPAEFVTDWGPEFDAESAYGAESRAVITELQPLQGEVPAEGRKKGSWFQAEGGQGATVSVALVDDGMQEDEEAGVSGGLRADVASEREWKVVCLWQLHNRKKNCFAPFHHLSNFK